MRNYKILPFVRQNFGMAAVTPATPLTTSLMVSKNFKISWYCEFQVHFGEYCKYFIIVLKPKHQSIVMRFDYLVKILQISGWGAPRLRDSHFSIEDFCKVHKIWRKSHQIYLSYHFWKKFKISFKIKLF